MKKPIEHEAKLIALSNIMSGLLSTGKYEWSVKENEDFTQSYNFKRLKKKCEDLLWEAIEMVEEDTLAKEELGYYDED
jgi:hypothetical protein